jgi:hypothetical protein
MHLAGTCEQPNAVATVRTDHVRRGSSPSTPWCARVILLDETLDIAVDDHRIAGTLR